VNVDLGHAIKDLEGALNAAKTTANNTNANDKDSSELVGKCTTSVYVCVM
jgi:hypothetical protein